MALINLQPKYAELHISQSHEGSNTHSISLNVEPKQGGDLGLQNWMSLRNVAWTVRFIVPNITERLAAGSIGTFSYVKEYCSPDSEIYLSEAIYIQLEIDTATFELLISTLQSGSLPDNISIEVFDLDTELWNSNLKQFVNEVENAPIRQYFLSSTTLPLRSLNIDNTDEIVKQWVLDKYSQIGRIASQLVNNLNVWVQKNPNEQNSRSEYLDNIAYLINTLRECRRYFHNDTDELETFWLKVSLNQEIGEKPENFLKSIVGFSKDEKVILKYRYDNVWNIDHPGIMGLIESGKVRKNSPPLDYPLVKSEHLEQVANIYTSNNWMQSPNLERLIIDALLFNETLAFALDIADIPPKNGIQLLAAILLKIIKLLISEIVALSLTGVFSNLIDSTFGVIFWIVFATITLGRWLNPIKVHNEIQSQKPKQLLVNMVSAVEKIQKPEFNGRLLRELLYGLEKRGAVYSPAIFNVLDKKIERESAK